MRREGEEEEDLNGGGQLGTHGVTPFPGQPGNPTQKIRPASIKRHKALANKLQDFQVNSEIIFKEGNY